MRTPTALLLLASASSAQFPIEPLVLEGETVLGVGDVTSINNLAVNDSGNWLIEIDTDGPADTDGALLLNGTLYLQHGDAILDTAISSFDTVNLNNSNFSGWNLFLTEPDNELDSGVFGQPGGLLIRESDVSAAAGFSAGTTWEGFFECKIDDAGNVLVMGSVDDPAVTSTIDRALVLLEISQGGGTITETVIVKEGDVLTGQTEAVADLETGPHNFDMNNNGEILFIADLAGDTTVDHAVYIDDTLIAQEGSPEANTGRNWSSLASAEVALNDAGNWVLSGSLAGDTSSNLLIVSDAGIVAQEGSGLAAIGAFTFTTFGSGPVLIDDDGDVLWYGDWNDPNTDVDTGLFLNDELLVQEGVSTVDGVVIDTLRGITDGYTMSENGRYIVFEAILQDGTEGAFQIDRFGTSIAMPGCFGNPGSLEIVGGAPPTLGTAIAIEMSGGPAGALATALLFSYAPIAGWPDCGIQVPGFGELLISFTPPSPAVTLFGGGGPDETFNLPLPVAPALVGFRIYSQGLFNDASGFSLTPGLELVLGEL